MLQIKLNYNVISVIDMSINVFMDLTYYEINVF